MPIYESRLVNLKFGDFMKKLVLGLAMLGLLTSSVHAKKVTTCMSYLVGATSEMTCSGDYSGKTTMQKLYKKGWKFLGNISGTSKFVLVFEK